MRLLCTLAVLLLLTACPTPPPTLSDAGEVDAGIPDGGGEPVPTKLTLAARGLYTFPNQLSEIPDGAFSRADDVVIRRPGIVETRRGFLPHTATFGSSGDRIRSMTDYNGTLVAHTSANKLMRYSGGAWTEYSGTYTPPSGRRMRFVTSAGSLYFTTNVGVYRLDEITGTPLPAGVPQALTGTVALSSNGAHATGTVTLGGGAGNVTITVSGTAVGPVTFNASDAQTATDCVTALNANATVSALVTASNSGTATITFTAVNAGTAGNAITLSASRSAGTATASGATLAGGSDGSGWLEADSQTAYRFVWGYRNANDRVILGAPSGRMSLTNPSTETVDTVELTVPVPSWVTEDYFLQVYRADTSGGEGIPAGDDMYLVHETYPTAAEIAAGELSFEDIQVEELKGAALYSSPNAGSPGSEKFQPPVCTDFAEYKGRIWCGSTTQRHRVVLTILAVDSAIPGAGTGVAVDDQIVLVGASETVFMAAMSEAASAFQVYTDGTASQNVANTAKSLVRVINASNTGYTAHYMSGEFDSPGQVLIEATDLGADSFTVETYITGDYIVPTTRNRFAITGISRTAGVVTVDTNPRGHNLTVGQVVTMPGNGVNFPAGDKTITGTPTSTTFTYAEAGANGAGTATGFASTTDPAIESDPSAAPNGIAYAEFGEPDAVPLGNYLTAGALNYEVKRVVNLGDTLFLLKEDGIFVLSGDTPETFNIREFPVRAKIVAPDSAVVVNNAIHVLTDQGVLALTETGAQVVSRPIEGDLRDLFAGSAANQSLLAAQTFGVAYETEHEYHLFLPEAASDTYSKQAYIYNTATQAWTRWTHDATAGYVLPGEDLEYLGFATANKATVERKTRTDADYQDAASSTITAYVDWAVNTGENPGALKHWQQIAVFFEVPSPNNVALSVATEIATTPAAGEFATNGLSYVSTYIPDEQSRSQTLTVGTYAGQSQKKFAITGLSVEYRPVSAKLR